MSVYNGVSIFADTMDSILSQEGVEIEFIVVNDGSTDKPVKFWMTMRGVIVACASFIKRITG